MRLGAACVAAVVALAAGSAMAQDAKPKPERAPGVTAERVAELMVGDRAPELAISEWVKGDPVTGFEEGKVYVVECWATWCGPCIAGMPHLSELQKEFKDKGVTIIGVNIWDDPANVKPFMEDRGGDEKMQYTVAIEEKIEGQDIQSGKIAKHWMEAAGRNGIPSAFIVDQKGYVAWIGHPGGMDRPLEMIVKGEWDIAKAAAEVKLVSEMESAFESGDMAKTAKLLDQILEMNGPTAHDPMTLNSVAWSMVDPDANVKNRPAKVAVKAAERAAELTEHKDPMILDTLAWAYYHAGQKDKAIVTEEKAIELAEGRYKDEFKKALEKMKK